MFVTILSIALVALTPGGTVPSSAIVLQSGSPSSAPALLGGGEPDAYGYSYLDSDTTAPGAPTYNWVSIKGVGTEVTGLGDDNLVGPFAIGFEFPYYWYRVNSVIVGSNGYITFGDKSANASPFKGVPSTAKPNNQLAPLLSDIDCTDTLGGSVWYWSNGADSFIVEYDSVQFWTTGGNNTFQILLTKADSSITFQYKEQSGSPYNGWIDSAAQVGIENISGAIGLNYLSGSTPAGNVLHPDLAVRFFPPESTSLQIHDVGVRNAMNDISGGMFAINDRPLSFWAAVKNYGNQAEASYTTYFKVTRQNNQAVFTDSMTAGASNPGETESLALANTWRPATNGTYIIKIYTKMTGDMLVSNDTATIELRVVTMPATLSYDNGTPVDAMSWNGPGGFGNRFVPPVYPCSISSIRQYMGDATGNIDVFTAIYDDDGAGGSPGTVLFGDTVTVTTTPGWCSVDLTTPVVITDGAFFVGSVSWTTSRPSFYLDATSPLSYQGWENTGVWGPSRDAPVHDVAANATISGPVGIFESMEPTPAAVPARIDVSPNPFGGKATIRLLNPTGLENALEVYDATGSMVRTVELSRGQATLDGRRLADGVYFARVLGTEAPVAKVIVTH
jgi:hypothetical protein